MEMFTQIILFSFFWQQILHKNVAHPKLDAYIKTQSWLMESGEYIVFPHNHSDVVDDVAHLLESIEEVMFYSFLSLNFDKFLCHDVLLSLQIFFDVQL